MASQPASTDAPGATTDRPIGTALAAPAAVVGGPDRVVADEEIEAFIADQLAAVDLDGRRVCVLVPDGTRTCPLPLLLAAIQRALHGRATRLSVLVAPGTHAAMTDTHLAVHLGSAPTRTADRATEIEVVQHAWWDRSTFVEVGTIEAERVAELSEGRLRLDIPIRINRAVVEADLTLIVGPVPSPRSTPRGHPHRQLLSTSAFPSSPAFHRQRFVFGQRGRYAAPRLRWSIHKFWLYLIFFLTDLLTSSNVCGPVRSGMGWHDRASDGIEQR